MTNTYKFPNKEDVLITIGDEKQHNFFPRMKIERWDNEVNFSVGIISDHNGLDKNITDTVEWDDGHGVKARFYEKPDDQFEFEIVLDEKPTSGKVLLSIETKGLDFLYQPELTKEEIDGGCIRPDNVVGSYAVYHQSMMGDYSKMGGNNYRAGKAFHIYRPFVTDANGKSAWCDLYIDKDMQIIIPQYFLDKAVYPIIIDPTFGANPSSPGSSAYSVPQNDMVGSLFTSPSDAATAVSLHVYSFKSGGGNAKGVLVRHSDLNILTNGVGGVFTVPSQAYHVSTFSTPPTLTGSTEYVLMMIPESGAYLWYDSGAANQGHKDTTNNYTTPENPTGAAHDSRKYAIYCTYTTAGVGVAPTSVFIGPFGGPFGGPIQ